MESKKLLDGENGEPQSPYCDGTDIGSSENDLDLAKKMENFTPVKLDPKASCCCPICNHKLSYIEGQPVQIIDGKFNMEDTEGRFYCEGCHSEYRRLLNTDYYQHNVAVKKRVENLAPLKLDAAKPESCYCPICNTRLKFISGRPVHIVNGKLNMKDTEDHFECPKCKGVYRRLLNTEYYQWYEE